MDILRRLAGSPTSCEHVPDELPEPQAQRCQECGSGFNLGGLGLNLVIVGLFFLARPQFGRLRRWLPPWLPW